MNTKCGPLLLAGVTALLVAFGCGRSEAEVQREAMLRVLRNDKDLSAQLRSAASSATSRADTIQLVIKYCDGLDQYDMSECPPDFRLAFRQHIHSWRTALARWNEMPDGFWQGVLMGAVNSLSGESDGGARRLSTEMREAQRAVDESYNEAVRIAAQYGAVL